MNDNRFFLTEDKYKELVKNEGLKRLGDLYDGNREKYFDSIYEGMELLGYTGAVLKVVKWRKEDLPEHRRNLSNNCLVNISDDDSILIEGPKGVQPYYLPYKKGQGLAILLKE